MTTKTLAPTDPRARFGIAVATATATIRQVTPDQLDRPTPCDDMTVRDLLQHLVGVLDRVAAMGRGDDPSAVPATDAPDDGWADAWLAAAHRLQDAWTDDAVLARPMALPWQQGTGADILIGYVHEVTVHTWDLAVATGIEPAWDDDVVRLSYDWIVGFLPAEGRIERYAAVGQAMGLDEIPMPFKPAVDAPADAPLVDRLAAWTGRTR